MRVVVSGTHGSGKSTLIGDFVGQHPTWQVLPDPYEYIDGADEMPDATAFFQQLRITAHRQLEPSNDSSIAERGPVDFLAYLQALETLGRPGRADDLLERGWVIASHAMVGVDLLVLLPLTENDKIELSEDEDLELREAMNLALLELADDPGLVGEARVLELAGSRKHRLAQLERAIGGC